MKRKAPTKTAAKENDSKTSCPNALSFFNDLPRGVECQSLTLHVRTRGPYAGSGLISAIHQTQRCDGFGRTSTPFVNPFIAETRCVQHTSNIIYS